MGRKGCDEEEISAPHRNTCLGYTPPQCVGETASWNNCIGTVTWPSGQKYVGEFRDGKQNGQGTHTWPDGLKYVGEYRDGKQNGQGTPPVPLTLSHGCSANAVTCPIRFYI